MRFALMTSVLFAGSFIAAKYTSLELQPLTTTLLRYLVALVLVFSIAFIMAGLYLILGRTIGSSYKMS